MPFIDAGEEFGNVNEQQNVPEGTYDLAIEKVTEQENEGRTMLLIRITNPPEDINDPAPIFHYINHPNGDDADKDKGRMLFTKRLFYTFGIETQGNGYDTDALLGATASATVTHREYEGRIFQDVRLNNLPDTKAGETSGRQGRRGRAAA